MGQTKTHRSVLVFLAIFSRYEQAMVWARKTAESLWGPIALSSDVFTFDQTDYYERQMGPDLKKQLLVFEQLKDPAQLIQWKHQANEWEGQFREEFDAPESRPLNIDPGYLTEAKLVLASTKERDHRLYLSRFLERKSLPYLRRREKKSDSVDLRPFVADVSLGEHGELRMEFHMDNGRTAKPGEILTLLHGARSEEILVTRRSQLVVRDGKRLSPLLACGGKLGSRDPR